MNRYFVRKISVANKFGQKVQVRDKEKNESLNKILSFSHFSNKQVHIFFHDNNRHWSEYFNRNTGLGAGE